MIRHYRWLAAALLLPLFVSVSPLFAASLVENFNDGTIDPGLELQSTDGFHLTVTGGALHAIVDDDAPEGLSRLFTRFKIVGDFTISALVHLDQPGPSQEDAQIGLYFFGGSGSEVRFINGKLTAEVFNDFHEVPIPAQTLTMRLRRTGVDVFAEYSENGTDFTILAQKIGYMPLGGNGTARLEVKNGDKTTQGYTGSFDDFTINAAAFEGGGSGGPTPTPTSTAVCPTPTPRPSPAGLDHFMSYGTKTTKGSAPFVPMGPVNLAGQLGASDYDIVKVGPLLLPANASGSAHDPATHYLSYAVKASKGSAKFVAPANVHIVNPYSDVALVVKKPTALLVPTAKNLSTAVDAPIEANHDLDHRLCYGAKAATKLPKGTQLELTDQFQTRLYDLTAISKLCVPVAKSGSPRFLKGDAKGTTAVIAPASIRHPGALLVCYQAKLATKEIPQLSCDPKAKGTKLPEKQPKHAPRPGIFVNNQLGPLRLDSTKEVTVCVPSVAP